MPTIGSLTTLAAGKAKRAEVNSNFSTIRTAVNTYCAFIDQSATISGAWTFSTAPVFSNAQTFAAGVTITTGGLAVTAGASTFGAAVTITGTCTATTFSGSGASLTNLPAANLTGDLPAIAGEALTSLNASNLSAGTVPGARLPTSYAALTITTATIDTMVSSAGAGSGLQLLLKGDQNYFLVAGTASQITATPPAGTDLLYLNVRSGGVDYRIEMTAVA
jgi:hypothetical protein